MWPTARGGAIVAMIALTILPGRTSAQRPADRSTPEAYFRAVAEFFRIPLDEVSILSEWSLPTDEIPVVLFVSRRGGVSTDALVVLRSSGRPWFDLSRRYGLDAGAFYVQLDPADAPTLSGTMDKFASLPRNDWGRLVLDDAEIVGLVNVRVISTYLSVPPARVLAERARSASYAGAYRALTAR